MLVTIIIPAYNAAMYVARAIQSAIEQDYRPIEIILVDNNSTDRTLDIFQDFQRRYPDIIQIFNCPTQGCSAARNVGLTYAQGEWIQFLDADDEILPDKISQQILSLQVDTNWIIAPYRNAWPDGTQYDVIPHNDPWKGLTYGHRIGCTCSNLYYKDQLISIQGWNEELPDTTDPDLHFRLLKSGANYQIQYQVATIYHHSNSTQSVSQRDPIGSLRRRISLYVTVIEYLSQHKPHYLAKNANWFAGALIAHIRRLATYDISEASVLYRKYMSRLNSLSMRYIHPLPHNPSYIRLYSLLGFANAERLRILLAGVMPNKIKRYLKRI